MEYQWYPGHMTRARRMMEENIRLVDLVIELVDARIPLSSRNPDIDALCRGKSRVVLLCKADLADPDRTEAFVRHFSDKGILAAAVDAREKKAGDLVRRQVQEACRAKLERDRARGIVGRPLRAMVAGIPNVGKSTFINSFAGRASARTGNKPGVTRGKQWIRMGGGVELLDTPGILWPKFDNPEVGMRLALAGAIRDEILDKEELAVWLLDYLGREYPDAIPNKYMGRNREEALPQGHALLLDIALARGLLQKGGQPDAGRAASMILDDCKNGRIGRISLDRPQDAEAFDAARASMAQDKGGKHDQGRDRGAKKAGKAAGRTGPGRKNAPVRGGDSAPGGRKGPRVRH